MVTGLATNVGTPRFGPCVGAPIAGIRSGRRSSEFYRERQSKCLSDSLECRDSCSDAARFEPGKRGLAGAHPQGEIALTERPSQGGNQPDNGNREGTPKVS